MSNLSKFHLTSSRASSNTSNQFKGYITESTCPVLHLYNEETSKQISLSLCDNRFMQSIIILPDKDYMPYGQSAYRFFSDMSELSFLDKSTQDDVLTLLNVIVFGHICEAICKAGIEIEEITSCTNLLNDFINSSLKYCGYLNKYKFDLSKLKHSIQIKEMNPKSMEKVIQHFILASNRAEPEMYCKGILGFTKNSIFIQSQYNKASVINYPDILTIEENKRTLKKCHSQHLMKLLKNMLK